MEGSINGGTKGGKEEQQKRQRNKNKYRLNEAQEEGRKNEIIKKQKNGRTKGRNSD